MSRIIKFKAKELTTGKWIYGYYYSECDNTYIIEDRQEKSMLNRNHSLQVVPSTVCEFTGLKDKNGEDVYDGDILRFIDKDGKQYIRYIEYKCCGFSLIDDKSKLCSELRNHQENGRMPWEVIGNKFDN